MIKRKNSKLSSPLVTPLPAPDKVLVVDIGGSSVKVLATGHTEPRKFLSGKKLTPGIMVQEIRKLTKDWSYNGVSIGYPGLVGHHGPKSEPGNLGTGWVGFDYSAAFGHPVKVINDAAMQALGSYDGGRMLFIGLGTGVGSTLISDNIIIPLELGGLWWGNKKQLFEFVGKAGRKRIGQSKWEKAVHLSLRSLKAAFAADYLVIGGGNASRLSSLPEGSRLGHNLTAFRGGVRLWNLSDVATLKGELDNQLPQAKAVDWRLA